jgi:Type II CAAX prenyl endopeptidase Rce1-like
MRSGSSKHTHPKQGLARRLGDDTISVPGDRKRGAMLFYIKRHLWLEITVTILLASVGLWAMHALNLPVHLRPSPFDVLLGVGGAAWLGVDSAGAVWLQSLQGECLCQSANRFPSEGVRETKSSTNTAGRSNGRVRRGNLFPWVLQQWLGLIVASLLFMVAHFARKDIRVVSYWSIFQGLYLGLFFAYSKNLIVPMIAHGLFDMGGMVYFRGFMLRLQNKRT